jgi:hypothetical protein
MRHDPSKRYLYIYGWTEQNEAAYGVTKREFDCVPGEDMVTIAEDGELSGQVIPEGTWFLSFTEAKQAAVKYWTRQRDIARRALKQIREAKPQ